MGKDKTKKKQYHPYINIFHSNIGKYKELSPKVLQLKPPTGGPFFVNFFRLLYAFKFFHFFLMKV